MITMKEIDALREDFTTRQARIHKCRAAQPGMHCAACMTTRSEMDDIQRRIVQMLFQWWAQGCKEVPVPSKPFYNPEAQALGPHEHLTPREQWLRHGSFRVNAPSLPIPMMPPVSPLEVMWAECARKEAARADKAEALLARARTILLGDQP